jgi:hypothetical protein
MMAETPALGMLRQAAPPEASQGSAMPGPKPGSSNASPVTAADVRHVAGAVADATVAAVLKTEPSMEEMEVAGSYLRGEGSKVDRAGHPMTGRVAQIYDILSADALYVDDEP